MRPVAKKYAMHFGYGEPYPPELKHLTADGKHHGQDYLTPLGTPVMASVDGTVNFVGFKRGYGKTVIVKFWTGRWPLQSTYRLILAHLSDFSEKLRVGLKIDKFVVVGESGDSGMATGHPHLHAEVQKLIGKDWIPCDPGFAIGKN